MPRLNSRGDYCAGVGEGQVHVNERVLAPLSGGIQWYDDDYVVYQTCVGSCIVVREDIRTGVKYQVVPHGANSISAGGRNWAVWFGSPDSTVRGITTASGARFPDSGLGPMGPDGAFAIKVDYQSYGPWDVLEQNGSRWRLTNGDAGNINLLGDHKALWSEVNGVVRTIGLSPPSVMLELPWWWLRPLNIREVWWLLYQASDGRLVAHPFDSLLGYELLPAGSLAYRPDWFVLPNGNVRIVWAISEGEWVGQVRFMDRTFTEPRVDLSDIWTPDIPDIPDPPDPEEPVDIPNHLDVVEDVNNQYPHLLQQNTKASCGEFTERVVLELVRRYPGEQWGHCGKNPDRTHCPCAEAMAQPDRLHAIDAIMFRARPDAVIDIIISSNGPEPGRPGWGEDESSGQPWRAPMPVYVEGGSGGGGGEPDTGTDEEQNARITALEHDVKALKEQMANTLQIGMLIGLRMNSGTILCATGGGPTQSEMPVTFESRAAVGAWESFKIEKGQG